MDYLTTLAPFFGPLAWGFFGLQIGILVAGVYLAFVRADPHPIRGPLLQRLAYALVALGVLGVLLGILRLVDVAPFTARYWLYLVAVFELALLVFAVYYSRVIYQVQLAAYTASKAVRRSQVVARPAARQSGPAKANGLREVPMPESRAPTSGRREARRERKRRKR